MGKTYQPSCSDEKRVILMSIHPQYAALILEGRKRVELRRRPIPRSVESVVVYATRPIGRVVGQFQVGALASGSPDAVWVKWSAEAMIHKVDFEKYFRHSEVAHVIQIASVTHCRSSVELGDLSPRSRPPVSWRYLRLEERAALEVYAPEMPLSAVD